MDLLNLFKIYFIIFDYYLSIFNNEKSFSVKLFATMFTVQIILWNWSTTLNASDSDEQSVMRVNRGEKAGFSTGNNMQFEITTRK